MVHVEISFMKTKNTDHMTKTIKKKKKNKNCRINIAGRRDSAH